MFKLIANNQHIVKSYDIYDLWRFIMSNSFDYVFLNGYEIVPTTVFLKIFLTESRNYDDYLRLERKLNTPITIYDYARKNNI